MLVSDFSYELPQGLIADKPLAERDSSRMMRVRRQRPNDESGISPDDDEGQIKDAHFHDFAALLRGDDLIVLNNTRVLPARLYGFKDASAPGTALSVPIEVLLTRRISIEPNEWQCLVKPGRKVKLGERLIFPSLLSGPLGDAESGAPSTTLRATVVSQGEFGERQIRFNPVPDFFTLLELLGHVPLPPYMHRQDLPEDRERYQTVYARELGSVAAPTAGLHFTQSVLNRLRERAIEIAEVTLHVGLGTFSPVRAERVEDHRIHHEGFDISAEAAAQINRALAQKRRVVAIGTTTVRTLEYAARNSPDGRIRAGRGEADIFIYPEYDFKVVGALLTNFHLPQSSLLMLACAFGSTKTVLAAYEHAVRQQYRFYSYGDCMFIE